MKRADYEKFKKVTIKPCPFCGNTEELEVIRECDSNPYDAYEYVFCHNCRAKGPEGCVVGCKESKNAIVMWNKVKR